MNEFRIKQEIKEEVPDDIYDNSDVYTDDMLMHPWKYEDEIDYYKTDEPNQRKFKNDDNFHRTNVDSVSNSKSTETNIHCENVYVDGEPSAVPTNQTQLNEQSGCTADPLAIPIPIPISIQKGIDSEAFNASENKTAKPLKKIKIVHVPPVRDLVQKTYSKRSTNDPKPAQKFNCSTCKRSFRSTFELLLHEAACFKCKQCNLIFKDSECFNKHMKTCKQTVVRKKLSWRNEQSTASKRKSCNVCMTTFMFDEDLEEHRKIKHFVSNAYACHLCDSKFDSEDEAHIHLKNAHIK